jgi:hypothetical protein
MILTPSGRLDVIVDRLSGLLRHLEPDGLAGLLLAHGCPIDGMTMRSNVLDPQADDVASSKLAIDANGLTPGRLSLANRDRL